MEEPNNYSNFDETYKESIKFSIDDGTYFKDAYHWFNLIYLRSIVDRSFFIFMSIMGIVIIYFVFKIILSILPLKQNIYITIKEKDLTKYQTQIYDISKDKDSKTTDEHILRYLLINYVKVRETHDYRTANINDINIKLTQMQNNSSQDVYNEFKYFMSSENVNGPYYYFGKDIETTIEITSFNFIRIKRIKFLDKIKDYFNFNLLPIKANVYYTLKTQIGDKITSKKRRASISFKYTGVELDEKTNNFSNIKFMVTDYKNYEVK